MSKMKKLIVILILIFVVFPLIVYLTGCTPCPVGCECIQRDGYIEVNCINGESYNITCEEDWERARWF